MEVRVKGVAWVCVRCAKYTEAHHEKREHPTTMLFGHGNASLFSFVGWVRRQGALEDEATGGQATLENRAK
jgi:hypothetical protein